MAKDNIDKQTYCTGASYFTSTEEKTRELHREYAISSPDEPLIGWMVKTPSDPWPESIEVGEQYYQKIKRLKRFAE